MDLARVGFETEPRRMSWTPADCALYAIALGAGFDELAFVSEIAIGHPQKVYPTFVLAGVMARESATWSHPGLETGDYAVHQIVLGRVRLELFGSVEPSGDVLVRTRVEGIYDTGKSAVVDLSVRAEDPHSGAPLFRAVNSLFVRGEGGFGGPPPPAKETEKANAFPPAGRSARDPLAVTVPTTVPLLSISSETFPPPYFAQPEITEQFTCSV